MMQITRDIKIDILLGKYKCISSYKIPKKPELWSNCPNCGLIPLVWEFDNGQQHVDVVKMNMITFQSGQNL